MVNIINEGWHRALEAQCALPSRYMLLCGAIQIQRIPWLGRFEAGAVSVLPAQGCWEGGVSVLLGFFGFGITERLQSLLPQGFAIR